MFDKKEEVTKAVEACWSLAAKYDRGQVIPWNEIERITGSRFDSRARHVIKRLRADLKREREIVSWVEPNVGVRLLTHVEVATLVPERRQRRAYRQVRRALGETALVNVGQLTIHQRKMLASQRSNMVLQRRDLFRSQKQLATGRATETNPRRRISA